MSFRSEYQGEWRSLERQCAHRSRLDRCPNVAQFRVIWPPSAGTFRAADPFRALEVCRECLPVVCERADEVLVVKLERRAGPVGGVDW